MLTEASVRSGVLRGGRGLNGRGGACPQYSGGCCGLGVSMGFVKKRRALHSITRLLYRHSYDGSNSYSHVRQGVSYTNFSFRHVFLTIHHKIDSMVIISLCNRCCRVLLSSLVSYVSAPCVLRGSDVFLPNFRRGRPVIRGAGCLAMTPFTLPKHFQKCNIHPPIRPLPRSLTHTPDAVR